MDGRVTARTPWMRSFPTPSLPKTNSLPKNRVTIVDACLRERHKPTVFYWWILTMAGRRRLSYIEIIKRVAGLKFNHSKR